MRIKLNIQRFASENSVVIKVSADSSDFNKEIDRIKKRLEELDEKGKKPYKYNGREIPGLSGTTIEEDEEYVQLCKRLEQLEGQAQKTAEAMEEIDNAEGLSDLDKEILKTNEHLKQLEQQLIDLHTLQEGADYGTVKNIDGVKVTFSEGYDRSGEYAAEQERLYAEYEKVSEKLAELRAQNQSIKEETRQIEMEANQWYGDVMMLSNGTRIVKRDMSELNGEALDTKSILERIDMKGLEKTVKKMSSEMSNMAKKAVRWGLAIVGVRRAITLVTRAFNTLQQYSEELKNTVSNIRLVMAVAFENIINKIISMVITLLNYVNYLSKAWFGVDLFARASELASKKMADNMAGAAGSAKEIRKQLAGFDEMNILGDNVGAAGGGGGLSGLDTSGFYMEERPIPEWLKWIKDNGDLVKTILLAIGAALIAIKIAPLLNALLTGVSTVQSFTAGLAAMAAGIVLLGGEIINLIFNWDEMDTKQKIVAVSLAALGAAMIAFGVACATGFSAATLGIGLVVAAVVALTTALVALIVKQEKEAKALEEAKNHQLQYNKAKAEAEKAVNEYTKAIDEAERTQKALTEAERKNKISGQELYDQVMNGTLSYEIMTEKQKEVFKAYMNNKTAQDNLKDATTKMNKEVLNSRLEAQMASKNYDEYFKVLIEGTEKGILSQDEMQQRLLKDWKTLDADAQYTFGKAIPDSIKQAWVWSEKDAKNFEKNWDTVLNNVKKKAEIYIKLKYGFVGGGLGGGGGSSYAKGGVVPIPRLASGAILNQPGRGVMIGGGTAIAGEAGAEGVIPLTDSQQMELLGKAIGRYITINANITNTMNGKVISRELQRVQNDTDFAANR